MNNKSFKNKLKWFFGSFIWMGILLLGVDIATKILVVARFTGGWSKIATPASIEADRITLIPGFLNINYLINEGAAFGLGFSNALVNRIIYIIVASAILIAIIWFFIKKYKKTTKLLRACLVLIMVGALGNLIDRIFYNADFLRYISPTYGVPSEFAVVDWIDFCGIWKFNFNIADSCIVIGIIILIIYLIVLEVKEYKLEKANAPKSEGPVLSKDELDKKNLEDKQNKVNK